MELKRRSSVTSFCHDAFVRSRAWTCFACSDFARPSLPWQLAHLESKVALASPGTGDETLALPSVFVACTMNRPAKTAANSASTDQTFCRSLIASVLRLAFGFAFDR